VNVGARAWARRGYGVISKVTDASAGGVPPTSVS
jgi:hypothetical protein